MFERKGKFIVVEGLEGAGKTSAIDVIQQCLTQKNISFITTREPGGTEIGESIRHILKDTASDLLSPLAELMLFYSARVQLLEEKIYPALKQGTWVIADRFEWSTWAYQGAGRGLSSEVEVLSNLSLRGFKPDKILYLDISIEQGLKRVKQRGSLDRIEQESIEFFEKVRACYQQLVIKHSDYAVQIDAGQSIAMVQEATLAELEDICDE